MSAIHKRAKSSPGKEAMDACMLLCPMAAGFAGVLFIYSKNVLQQSYIQTKKSMFQVNLHFDGCVFNLNLPCQAVKLVKRGRPPFSSEAVLLTGNSGTEAANLSAPKKSGYRVSDVLLAGRQTQFFAASNFQKFFYFYCLPFRFS